MFDRCLNINIDKCSLYGCNGVSVTNSAIKNNSSSENSYFISTYDCSDIEFSGCDFSNNSYYNFLQRRCCKIYRMQMMISILRE